MVFILKLRHSFQFSSDLNQGVIYILHKKMLGGGNYNEDKMPI